MTLLTNDLTPAEQEEVLSMQFPDTDEDWFDFDLHFGHHNA